MSPASLVSASTFAEIQQALSVEVQAIPAYQQLAAAYRAFDGDAPDDSNKGGEDYIMANAPIVLNQLSDSLNPAAAGVAANALHDRMREALTWVTKPDANPLLTSSSLRDLIQQLVVVATKVQNMAQFAMANATAPGGPAVADAQALAYIVQDEDFQRLLDLYGQATQYAQKMANMNVPTTPPPGGWG